MKVVIDQNFPRVIKYELNNKVLNGSEDVIDKIRINKTEWRTPFIEKVMHIKMYQVLLR